MYIPCMIMGNVQFQGFRLPKESIINTITAKGLTFPDIKTFRFRLLTWQKHRNMICGGYDYKKKPGCSMCRSPFFTGQKAVDLGMWRVRKSWDRNLTDEDGPYIELMTGVIHRKSAGFQLVEAI